MRNTAWEYSAVIKVGVFFPFAVEDKNLKKFRMRLVVWRQLEIVFQMLDEFEALT